MDLRLRVNGTQQAIDLDPRTTLLDLLRDRLGLTGAKRGCDRGECGACTVLVDGRPALGCLTLAVSLEGRDVITIEGLAPDGTLHPIQQAFVDHDALQCGFCTPGQILAATALLEAKPNASDGEIRDWMSGNLCRCAAYPQILAAVRSAAGAR
jgi:xanthine dehydrogenase YagT iron-sulfur-binding subunit